MIDWMRSWTGVGRIRYGQPRQQQPSVGGGYHNQLRPLFEFTKISDAQTKTDSGHHHENTSLENGFHYLGAMVPVSIRMSIADRVTEVLREIDGAVVDANLLSKMLRVGLRVDDAAIQVEVNVSDHCETIPMAPQRVRRDLVTARTDWWHTAWSGLVAYGLVIGLSDMPSTRCGRISPPAPLRWQPKADRHARHLLTSSQT